MHQLEDMASPVGAFVRERCDRGPGLKILSEHLYHQWTIWREQKGIKKYPGDAEFGTALFATCPELTKKFLSVVSGQKRKNYYVGISLRPEEPEQDDRPLFW